MIRMINGSTRVGLNLYTAASGAFEADAATEKRLVSLGAAEYVTETPQTPAETGAPAAGSSEAGNDNPEAENGATGQETSENGEHRQVFDADMSVADLRAAMKERGLSAKVGMSKAQMIVALEAYQKDRTAAEPSTDETDDGEDEEPVEDGEQPPDLGSEDIVV